MTTEERARAYDEALEKARKINSGEEVAAPEGWSICEVIFPELKESEDEKIRKVLVGWFKSYKEEGTCGAETFNGIPTDDIIAWFEKQGEQKKDFRERYDKIADSEWFKKTHENMSVDIEGEPHGKNALEVINEEKVDNANKVEPKFKVGDTMRTLQEANDGYTEGMPVVVSIDNEYYHCTNELIAIKDQDDYEFPPINVKQKHDDKPKWSEEDDGMVACIKVHLKQCLNNYTYTRYSRWLESLEQRMEE